MKANILFQKRAIFVTNSYSSIINEHLWQYAIQKRSFFSRFFKKKDTGCGGECDDEVAKCLTRESKIETKGMCMPIIGIGTWQVDPCCIDSVISYALDTGYRHIDTSHSYGNQAAIGQTLQNLFKCGKYCRKELFISSKLPYYGMQPNLVCTYVDDSLKNLCIDYLDLFMIHFPVGIKEDCGEYVIDRSTNHIEIWQAMEEQVRKGKVKSLGLSNFNCRQIMSILKCAKVPPANLQLEMHVFLQQKQLVKFCKESCISVTAYAPLGSPELDQYLIKNNLQANKVPDPLNDYSIRMIACFHKKTPSQVLLRYLIEKGVAVIPKSSKPDRICKNIDLFDFELQKCERDELCAKDLDEKGRKFGCNVWCGTEGHPEYPF